MHAVFLNIESFMKQIIIVLVVTALLLNSCGSKGTNEPQSMITAEMAYEGVEKYCHKEYDWSVAEDNPDMMSVQMGEETETEYQVVFRSYTGAFVYFYVDKASGTTKLVEKVPNLGVEEDDGEHQSSSRTINLFDYIEKKD